MVNSDMKCVMVVNQELDLGLIANTAAVLAVSLGAKIEGIIGEDLFDQAGTKHPGITQLPIPILKGDSNLIRELRGKLLASEAVYVVDFCDAAQQSKHYDQYRTLLNETPAERLQYLGLAAYGPTKAIKRLTGNLPLLR